MIMLAVCLTASVIVHPILENALDLNTKKLKKNKYFMSIKPIYTQSVGDKLDKYFNICLKECLAVREDGSGDIDSLWFSVISTDSTFYSSTLTFEPKRQTYGAFSMPLYNCQKTLKSTCYGSGGCTQRYEYLRKKHRKSWDSDWLCN